MTNQQKQIIELAEEIGVTINGYTADVFPHGDGVIVIERGKIPSSWIEEEISKLEELGQITIMPYSFLERELLINNGNIKTI